MFANSQAFRDLKNDSTITQANREARNRGTDNPIFTDDSLLYDGVVIREIPEIAALSGVGAGAIDVAPNFLCGAQALAVGWAKKSTSKTETFDYGDKVGVAIEEIRGINKMRFEKGAADSGDFVDHGVVTVYTAGVADA